MASRPMCRADAHVMGWRVVVNDEPKRRWWCNFCNQPIEPGNYFGHCGNEGCWDFVCGGCWRERWGKPPANNAKGAKDWAALQKQAAKPDKGKEGAGDEGTASARQKPKKKAANPRMPPLQPLPAEFCAALTAEMITPTLAGTLPWFCGLLDDQGDTPALMTVANAAMRRFCTLSAKPKLSSGKGEGREAPRRRPTTAGTGDVEMVMQQCNVSHSRAKAALEKCDGDVVNAIMSLIDG